MAEETKRIGEITEEDAEALRRLTAYMLPDSPAAAGLPAAVVKKYFYQWLVDNKQSLVALINRIVGEVNGELGGLGGDVKKLKEDAEALKSGKLDKITKRNGSAAKQCAYVMGDEGEPTLLPYTRKSDKYTLVRRDQYGNALVKTPADSKGVLVTPDNEHIVNVAMLEAESDALKKNTANSVKNIPDATANVRGMMTAEQVRALEALVALAGDPKNGDSNDLIDKIHEVLDAFEGTEEQFNLLDKLNGIGGELNTVKTDIGSLKTGKVSVTDSESVVYATDANGAFKELPYSFRTVDDSVMVRDANGKSRVNDPSSPLEIANKRYVDDSCEDASDVLNARIDVESTRIDAANKHIAALRELVDPTRFETVKSQAWGGVEVPENALTYAAIKEVAAVFTGTGNLMPWTESCYPDVLTHNFEVDPSSGEVLEGGVLKSTLGVFWDDRCWDLSAYLMPGTYTLRADVTVIENGGANVIAFGLVLDSTLKKHNNFNVPTDVSADNPYTMTLSINLNIDKKGKWYLLAQGGGSAQNYENLDVRFSNIQLARGKDVMHIPPYLAPEAIGSFSIVSEQGYNLFDATSALTASKGEYPVEHAEGSLYVASLSGSGTQYITCVEITPGTYTLSFDVDTIGAETSSTPTAVTVLLDVESQKTDVNNLWDTVYNEHYKKYTLRPRVETGGRYVFTFTIGDYSEIGFAFPGATGSYKRIYNIQLNEGTVAYPYVAYPGKTLDSLPFHLDYDPRLMHYNPYYPEEHNRIDLEHQEMVFVGEMVADGEDWVRYANEERVPLPEPVDDIIRVGYSGYGRLLALAEDYYTDNHPSFTVEFQKEVST